LTKLVFCPNTVERLETSRYLSHTNELSCVSGKMGPLLKCTLDDIVLIKFHSLCWKVAMFSTALCLCIILPLNYTAECDSTIVGDLECEYLKNLTNFEQTTLAHIPSLKGTADTSVTNSTIIDVNARLFGIVIVAWIIYIFTCGKSHVGRFRQEYSLAKVPS
jgi:hypothetical protein